MNYISDDSELLDVSGGDCAPAGSLCAAEGFTPKLPCCPPSVCHIITPPGGSFVGTCWINPPRTE